LALREFIADMYPNLPHQRCTVHLFMAARAKIAQGRRVPERARDLIALLQSILWSRTRFEAQRRFKKLWSVRSLNDRERRALVLVWKGLSQCFICRDRRFRHLHLPRSSNAIENVMGQIEARLKTRRGAKSIRSTELLINEILRRVKRQVTNQ
jgi:hypothetical protein